MARRDGGERVVAAVSIATGGADVRHRLRRGGRSRHGAVREHGGGDARVLRREGSRSRGGGEHHRRREHHRQRIHRRQRVPAEVDRVPVQAHERRPADADLTHRALQTHPAPVQRVQLPLRPHES